MSCLLKVDSSCYLNRIEWRLTTMMLIKLLAPSLTLGKLSVSVTYCYVSQKDISFLTSGSLLLTKLV